MKGRRRNRHESAGANYSYQSLLSRRAIDSCLIVTMLHLQLRFANRFLALELFLFSARHLRGTRSMECNFFGIFFVSFLSRLSSAILSPSVIYVLDASVESNFFNCVCLIVAFQLAAEPFLPWELWGNSRLFKYFSQPSPIFFSVFCLAAKFALSTGGVYIKQIKNMQMRMKIQRIFWCLTNSAERKREKLKKNCRIVVINECHVIHPHS